MDTGFIGALLIPREAPDRMGSRIRDRGYFTLADGRTATALIARGLISWFAKEHSIDIFNGQNRRCPARRGSAQRLLVDHRLRSGLTLYN